MSLSRRNSKGRAMPTAVPSPQEVTTYLAAHSLEAAIEEAVNDAVLKQVKNPCLHIAQILMKKSQEKGEEGATAAMKSVSLDGPPAGSPGPKKAGFAANEVSAVKEADTSHAVSGEEISRCVLPRVAASLTGCET
jgi:hypothetical protein